MVGRCHLVPLLLFGGEADGGCDGRGNEELPAGGL